MIKYTNKTTKPVFTTFTIICSNRSSFIAVEFRRLLKINMREDIKGIKKGMDDSCVRCKLLTVNNIRDVFV